MNIFLDNKNSVWFKRIFGLIILQRSWTNNHTMQDNFAQLRWLPVIERADIPNAYLISLPYNSFLTGNYQKVPILIGITSEEGLCKFTQ